MANSVPVRLNWLALCCSLSLAAEAAPEAEREAAEGQAGAVVLGETRIEDQRAQNALPPVYQGGQVARGGQLGVLGNQDIMDVPFSMSSYTEALIEDQQAEDIGQVLLNDSSVRQASGFANAAQVFVIRGFPVNTDDISYNGLYGVLPRQIISTDALERVEVFKGPNAFINGVTPTGSGIGGGINLQPKRAQDDPIRRFTLDVSGEGRVGEHLDLGQRFGADSRFGARLNLGQREGETAVDDEPQRTKLFAIGLDYRGDAFRWSGDFAYQKQRVNGGRNIVQLGAGLTSIPDAPDADTNYAPDWNFTELEDTFGMSRIEYDLNDDWTLYAAGGAKHTREVGRYTTVRLLDEAGTTAVSGSFIPHDEDNTSVMAGLNGEAWTGPVSHKINLGLAGIWAQQKNAFDFDLSTRPSNLYDPVDVAPPNLPGTFRGGDDHDPAVTGKTTTRSAAISDTLGFSDDRLLVTIGLRRQSLLVQGYNYDGFNGVRVPGFDGARNAKYDESITTPVYGIVLKPWEHVAFYINRIEGLAQGPTAPANTVNVGEVFSPARTKQIEAGVKVDMGSYGATLGVYRIEQPADGFTNADNVFVRDGQQVNKGVELNLFGEPLNGLRLIGGVTVMDTELEDTEDGLNDGNDAIGVPSFQFNASADWDVPGLDGLALNARMLRTGGQEVNAANTLSIPTWNRFDVGARYSFQAAARDVTVRLNVENLTDEEYWASSFGGYLTQGEPRLIKLSGTLEF
ncbi:TonB-dependent siderophore receptor [Pseudomonas sp. UL073]|uniref:TonB-dependent siderophore receptor n=1 Tax=Zestomonas insulae TaxID=2809017 RepID=A0ABS2IF97_9GAMM|nr:TonB-dependent siderophore receptor [Pseudomonas insulae]MBM7060592.1 TonB-dependent siderophore receptor [Pseudomonas insulae]